MSRRRCSNPEALRQTVWQRYGHDPAQVHLFQASDALGLSGERTWALLVTRPISPVMSNMRSAGAKWRAIGRYSSSGNGR
jgi:hypothetical protein